MTRTLRRLRTRHPPWWRIEAAMVVAFGILIARWHASINLDAALYLDCGRLLLAGKVPYVDFVDINPPWVMYAMTPVAWVARVLSLPVTLAFALMVGALLALSWLELRALLGRSAIALRPHELGTIAIGWIAASMAIFSMGDLGEREHLFMLGYVPFLLLRHLRFERSPSGRRPATRAPGVAGVAPGLAVLIGLQAGAGACFKPEFVAMALAAEIGLLLGHRTWRWRPGAEVASSVAVGVAYAAHWAFVPAAMRDAFFQRWAPFVVRGYDAYSVSLRTMIASVAVGDNLMGLGVAAMLMGAWLAWRRRGATRGLLPALAAIGAVSAAAHVLQRREWSYHLTPFYMAGVLALLLLWVEVGRAAAALHRLRRARFDLVAAPAAAGVAAVALCLVLAVLARHKPLALADAVTRLTTRGERVLVLSTSVFPAYPAMALLERPAGSRYLWDFPIAFYLYERRAAASSGRAELAAQARDDEHRFLGELTRDIDDLAPRLIAISTESPCQGCPDGVGLESYLEQAGVLDHIRARYQERPSMESLRLFVRAGS